MNILFVIFNYILNILKSIFRPVPDLRYKLFFENNLIKNSLDECLIPFELPNEFDVELLVNDKKINLPVFTERNKKFICGLPIITNGETKIIVIDIIEDEVIYNITYEKNKIVNYNEIYDILNN